jgi:hypothetical protein
MVMAFQFGSTTRLRHMNYPEKRTQWNQTEPPTPVATVSPLNKNPTFTLDGNEENVLMSQGQIEAKGNHLVTNHRNELLSPSMVPGNYRSDNTTTNSKNNKNNNNNNLSMQTNFSTHHIIPRNLTTTSQQTVSIEWDVLESFSEFAAFLELQNPICPAEHVDTPEKLMNVLAWDLCV